jgi:hypothetical protein
MKTRIHATHVPVAEPSTASEADLKDRTRPAKPLLVPAPYLLPQVEPGLEWVRFDDDAVVGGIDQFIDGRCGHCRRLPPFGSPVLVNETQ